MKSKSSVAFFSVAIIAAFTAGTFFPGALSPDPVYAQGDSSMRTIVRKSRDEDAVISVVPQIVAGEAKVRLWITPYSTDSNGNLRMASKTPVQIVVPDENTLYLGCTVQDEVSVKAIGIRGGRSK